VLNAHRNQPGPGDAHPPLVFGHAAAVLPRGRRLFRPWRNLFLPGGFLTMARFPTRHLLTLPRVAFAVMCLTPALMSAGSAAPTRDAMPRLEAGRAADIEQEFADAPDGVDPVVTGPVTAAFRERQIQAGCDTAEWPNIPRVCYPD
jgi:hypothetical protein